MKRACLVAFACGGTTNPDDGGASESGAGDAAPDVPGVTRLPGTFATCGGCGI